MDSSTAQRHNQEMMGSKTLESMLAYPKPHQEKKPRPADQQALNCPRCDSTNTKFCYYNNYSLSQPRYFCKSCRRYWTKGGTLRNVPVGGGCRKNKRSSPSVSSSCSFSSTKKSGQDQPTIPSLPYSSGHDPSLAIATLEKQNQFGILDNREFSIWGHQPNSMPSVLGSSGGLFDFDEMTPNGFGNLYSGGHLGLMGNGRAGFSGEMNGYEGFNTGATTTSTAVTTVKQEGEGRGNLWGMTTWQNVIGGDEFDSGRLNWHIGGGVLNSPLM